jgi:hypothetical protein
MMKKIKNIFSRLFKSKKHLLFFVFFVAAGTLLAGSQAHAGAISAVGSAVAELLSWIIYPIVALIGFLISKVLWIFIGVAQYNDFINAGPVTSGWAIVRDLCNMFFILILLIIAFATILRVEGYDIKKMVPRVIIMAVLINFSKTICGLILDAAGLIMNTFVAAFKDQLAGGFLTLLGVDKIMQIQTNSNSATIGGEAFGSAETIVAILLALCVSVVALVVIIVLLSVLIMRTVMIWIYVVLSPLAYLLATFPQGKKYSEQWWKEFTNYVIVGPILAFFIWLSLTSISVSSDITRLALNQGAEPNDIKNAFTNGDTIIRFIIGIGMLLGGLIITQQAGGAIGKIAGAGMAKIQGGANLLKKGAVGGLDFLNRQQAKSTGIDLNLARQGAKISESLKRGKERELSQMELKASSRLAKGGLTGAIGGIGARGWGDTYLRGFLGMGGMKQSLFGGQKKVEEMRQEQERHEGLAKTVMSEGEYNSKKTELDTEYSVAVGEKTKVQNDYDQKVKNAEDERNRVANTSGIGSDDYNKANEAVKTITTERNSKVQEADTRVAKADQSRKDLDSRRSQAAAAGLLFADDTTAFNRRKQFQGEADKFSRTAAKYTVVDYEGQAARRSARSAAGKNIDSENEDELIAQFEVAVSRKNEPLAEALLAKICKVGGSNALLNKYGYQAKSGMTKAERAPLEARVKAGDQTAAAEIQSKQGFNDFIRDIFVDRLKVDEQGAFALESDMSSIGEQVGKEHLMKTVTVDNTGKYIQVDHKGREEAKLREALKTESEGNIRKLNRLFYGSENSDTGEFEWSDFGLAMAVNNIGLIQKEIGQNRFNKSAARAFAEPKALKKLMDKIKQIGVQNVRDKEGNPIDLDKFTNSLINYAAAASNDNIHALLNNTSAPTAGSSTTP